MDDAALNRSSDDALKRTALFLYGALLAEVAAIGCFALGAAIPKPSFPEGLAQGLSIAAGERLTADCDELGGNIFANYKDSNGGLVLVPLAEGEWRLAGDGEC